MYNRYIPQPDGSFRRRQVLDPPRPAPPPKPAPVPSPPHQDCAPPPPPPAREAPGPEKPPGHKPPHSRQEGNVSSFLKNLLPDTFDTGDLFVVMLLLLMAGDREEDKNTALLTLALYFLM